MVLLGEVLVVTGVESPMALHLRLVGGDEVEVLDGEERETGIVTMNIGGYRRPEGIVTLRLPDVVRVETVEVAEEGRGTRDLAARPAEIPDTIERAVGSDRHTRWGDYVEYSHEVDYTPIFDLYILFCLYQLQPGNGNYPLPWLCRCKLSP